ncbi:hypothetical protein GCM10020000_42250 [Streptomyces olivoverticillatus]
MDRVREALRRALPALGLYAVVRLTGMTVMAAWAWWIGRAPAPLLGHLWDGIWYAGDRPQRLLSSSCPPHHARGGLQRPGVLHPLFPGLVRAVATLSPFTVVTAGRAGGLGLGGGRGLGIHAVGERLHGRRVATLLVLLWGLLPHAIVQTMAHTESLMTALAAWSLYALLTGRRLWAGCWRCWPGCQPNAIAGGGLPCCAPRCSRPGRIRGPAPTGGCGQGRRWRPSAGQATSPGRGSGRGRVLGSLRGAAAVGVALRLRARRAALHPAPDRSPGTTWRTT